MQLTIHDATLRKVAFIDTERQGTLNFYQDRWIRELESGGSIFEFTVFKKELKYDTSTDKTYTHINDRAFVSFTHNNKSHLMTVYQTEETETYICVTCQSLNMELLNEYCGKYKADKAYTFKEYCDMWEILSFSALTIGTNEVKDKRLTLEWEGEDTKLKRLLSIANKFGAEIEFETKLNYDSSLNQYTLNIYKAHDENNHGVGQRRADVVLEYNKNISGIKRTVDKSEIVNAIKPVGKKEITEKKVTKIPKTRKVTKKVNDAKNVTKKYTLGDLRYAGHTLKSSVVQQILDLCVQYKILPSGVLAQIYLESWWGASNVSKRDNNWTGLTWTGSTTRPSGIKVTRGTARPSSEGGHYMHFASVSDYIKDYLYLLGKQGIYKVSGATTIDAYTKGLFRVGGAKYDYAAAGYGHYAPMMRSIRNGVNNANGKAMDKLDQLYRGSGTTASGAPKTTITKRATKVEAALKKLASLKGKRVGSGQCYAIPAYYANVLGGPGLNGGVTGFRGRIGAGVRASHIGTDYNWGAYGWKSFTPKSVADLKAGAIANIKPNTSVPNLVTGYFGHTVVIKSASGGKVTVYEQNYANRQWVEERTYTASAYLRAVQTVCYPPELAQGSVVGGIKTTTSDSGTVTVTENYFEAKVEETQKTVDLFISNSNKQTWKNEAGEVEFYVKNGLLYAPLSKAMYPSVLSGSETDDNWIRRDIEVDTDKESVLVAEALKKLKANAYPKITYEVEGVTDLDLGDTVMIRDTGFVPTLLLEARVVQQELSFTDPSQNKTVFANFKELESEVSDGIVAQLEIMREKATPFELMLSTSHGTAFKNNEGESLLTVQLSKAGKVYDDALIFYKVDDDIIGSGKDLLVHANDFEKVWNITVEAYLDNDIVASRQVTFTDTVDGKTQFTHKAYANKDKSGNMIDFSLIDPAGRDYLGLYIDFDAVASTDPNAYKWSLIKGEDGAQGIPGKDGKTYHTHIAYADKSTDVFLDAIPSLDSPYLYNGATGTSTKINGGYKITINGGGHRQKHVMTFDGTTGKRVYVYLKLKNTHSTNDLVVSYNGIGATLNSNFREVTVKPNQTYVDLRQAVCRDTYPFAQINIISPIVANDLSYEIYEYALYNSVPFVNFSTVANLNAEYIGVYTDMTAEDSTDPTKYNWSLIKGLDGAQGIQGRPGKDGKTPYWHTAYANSVDGKTDFSLTDSTNKRFIGQYTDYTQADSTDPTKYKWVDMVGTVEVDGRNLWASTKILPYGTVSNPFEVRSTRHYTEIYTDILLEPNQTYTISYEPEVKIGNIADLRIGIGRNAGAGARNYAADFIPWNSANLATGTFTFTTGDIGTDKLFSLRPVINSKNNNTEYHVVFKDFKLEKGNIPTGWSPAPEDVDAKIDAKADSQLTAEQLNALAEQAEIMKAELAARASLAALDELVATYQKIVKENGELRQESEEEFRLLSQRVVAVTNDLKDQAERWNFLDNYFTVAEEGLVFGKQDSSSAIKITDDRISMFSAGQEVMYISQGVLEIKNGIFSVSVQIGFFREEQHPVNKAMNVMRYVGENG